MAVNILMIVCLQSICICHSVLACTTEGGRGRWAVGAETENSLCSSCVESEFSSLKVATVCLPVSVFGYLPL